MIKENRLNNWIKLLNLKYNSNFEKVDSGTIISYKAFKNGKRKAYLQILINTFTTINLENYLTWYGSLDFIKLDAKFHNILVYTEGLNLYELSGIEKAKKVLNKKEFELLRKYLSI